MKLSKSLIKLFLFLLVITFLIATVKWMAGTKRHDLSAGDYVATLETDTAIFFLGTSRVQHSTDPRLIASLVGKKTYNLGLSSWTFLSHSILAEYIMRQPGHKVLFIELSTYVADLPEGVFLFSKQTGFDPVQSARRIVGTQPSVKQLELEVNLLNRRVGSLFNLREDVKTLVGYRVQASHNWIGFQPSQEEGAPAKSSFIVWDEIYGQQSHGIDLSMYKGIIAYLESVAKSNHAKLVFLLPLNYRIQSEKKMAVSLFHSLPDSSKLHYDKSFLDQMASSDYLSDQLHLNDRGAEAYSTFIATWLRERIE